MKAAVIGIAILFVGAAGAQQALTWIEAPSVADMAAAYPAKAKAAGVGGMVNLSCQIDHERRPHDCAAIGEQPSGYGFGFAARKLAEKMRIAETGLSGQEVRIPVSFDAALAKGETPTILRPAWAQLPAA